MKNILVTGGAGFIGSNFVLETLESRPQYAVTVLDNLTYAGNLENLASVESDLRFQFKKGSITNADRVAEVLQECDADWMVHFAAESHVDRSIQDPSVFLKTNVLGTFTLLEACRQAWEPRKYAGKRFLHISTDEVYGSLGKTGYFTEESSYQPNSPYSASKAGSDHIVRSYFHTFNMPVITTNCSNNYGPFQFPEKLIPLIINNIIQGKPLPVYGKGENVRDWLYVVDHCRALLTALEKGVPGETYNIGGHNEWKNIDIVNLLCDILDDKLNRKSASSSRKLIQFVKDRPGHDLRYAIDAGKIQRELGWTPRETFETGIEKTVDWYLDHREWLEHVTSGEYQNYYRLMYG